MTESVECLASSSYPGKPLALKWEGQRLKIVKILAQWRTPTGIYFRVHTNDGQEFELNYREANNEWQIHQP